MLADNSRMVWYVCMEQRVFCRKMGGDDDDHAQRRVEPVGMLNVWYVWFCVFVCTSEQAVTSGTLLSAPNGNVEPADDEEGSEEEYVDVPYTYEVEEVEERETTKDEVVERSIPRLRALFAYKGNGMEIQKGEVASVLSFLL